VKELNKLIEDLKVEIENLGKRSGITDVSITNRIQEIEERTTGVEETVEEIDTTVKKFKTKQNKKQNKTNKQKTPNPNHPGNSVH
jgi:RNA processing factor Prp31